MSASVFTDKKQPPSQSNFRVMLGQSAALWDAIHQHGQQLGGFELEWKHYGRKIGWLGKVLLHRRNLFFVIPDHGHFRASFTFGQKAVEEALSSDISSGIKAALQVSKTYVEGRSVVIDLQDHDSLADLMKLLEVKLRN